MATIEPAILFLKNTNKLEMENNSIHPKIRELKILGGCVGLKSSYSNGKSS